MTIRKLLNYWFKKKRAGFYLWMGTGTAALYFAGFMVRSSLPGLSLSLSRLGFAGFVMVITGFFIHLNLHSVHWFLDHFKDTDHLPKKQMALVNSFCMTLFLALCLGALPGTAWALEPLWQAVGRWFSHRVSLEEAVYPALHMETEAVESLDLSLLPGEVKPTPDWVLTFDRLLRAAASVLVAILILMAVRAALKGIWSWITRPREFDNDEKIYLTPVWSLLSRESSKTRARHPLKARTYGEKIRRQYKKEILTLSRKKKLPLSASLSPAQLEQAVGMERPVLHELYEKARYGRQECTRADWETISKEHSSPG